MKKNRKKIAILFHGLVHRSLEYTNPSFERYVLHPLQKNYDVDVFHHSWVTKTIHNPRGSENNIPINLDAIDKFLPYSKGVIESQDDYDSTINPSFFTDKNPMIGCTKTKEDAFITAMNSLRDLESTKRAFEYMEKKSDRKYDYVIVCRPDVEFLNTFRMYGIEKEKKTNVVFAPFFDNCGGTNDRFAVGDYKTIKIYCSRIDGAVDWMRNGLAKNSESYLKKHLTENNVEVKHIFLFFRRIRATGEIFYQDMARIEKELPKITTKIPAVFILMHVCIYIINFFKRRVSRIKKK